MRGGKFARRLRRRGATPVGTSEPPSPPPAAPNEAWPGVCDRFAMQILVLAEQLRPALDQLETDEQDPDKLQHLYEVDHAVARMRRAARELRVLADRDTADLDGHVTSLMDVIRVAESSIDHYSRVRIGNVAELAVLSFATDDVASILSALLDNATAYSPGAVHVSAHLLEDGGVMFRIEDSGIGMEDDRLHTLNTVLAGDVPPVDETTGRRTGFPVVHRLARKHGARVRLVRRPAPEPGASSGTTAMVSLPPELVCELPAPPSALGARDDLPPSRAEPHTGRPSARTRPAHLAVAPGPVGPPPPPEPSAPPRPHVDALPRRERQSLRGRGAENAARAPSRPLARGSDPAPGGSFADDVAAFSFGGRRERHASTTSATDDRPDNEVQ